MPVMTRQEHGSLGGKQRAANQTPEQRRAVARLGGRAAAAKKQAAKERARLAAAVNEVVERVGELSGTQREMIELALAMNRHP
jgi:hypothetical protein